MRINKKMFRISGKNKLNWVCKSFFCPQVVNLARTLKITLVKANRLICFVIFILISGLTMYLHQKYNVYLNIRSDKENCLKIHYYFINIHIHTYTYHSRFIPEGVAEVSQIFLETPTFYQH
jgi:hypothetical protein